MSDFPTPIIGVEVHVELTTESKMFCGCPAAHFGIKPNTHTCPVCLGMPGGLPVANKKAIEETIMIGLALNCRINRESHFDRKQYFYPDLPKGYQISQYDQPLCVDGYLLLSSGKKIGIERVHLEEDTAKLQHTTIEGKGVSLIDFNRSGVPLVEIVSKPDLSSSEEAKEFLKSIHQLVVGLRVSTADMEKGQMRLEPTVNVQVGSQYTPLVELKNINSFNFAAAAIDYEIKRQVEELAKTGVEKTGSNKTTRGYDSERKLTFAQREKEEAKDYRYFPEPDIPPLRLTEDLISAIEDRLPELPEKRVKRLKDQGLREDYARQVVGDEGWLKLAEEVLVEAKKVQVDTNKVLGEVINGRLEAALGAKELVEKVKARGEKTYLSEDDVAAMADTVIAQNEKSVADYRAGKQNAVQFLLGQVMARSKGQAQPQMALKILKEKLD